MALPTSYIETLLVSVLAVNGYSLLKVQDSLEGFRAQGLTNALAVARMEQSEIILRLRVAGYDRGKLAWKFADRVHDLMAAIADGKVDVLPALVRIGDRDQAERVLVCVFRPSRSAIPADADHPFRQGDHPGRDAAG